MIVRENSTYHQVPSGFKTDLASIPRIMWPVFSPSDYDSIGASVLHDWHYCCDHSLTRRRADDLFYYALRSNGMNCPKAFAYWFAVRAFGERFYKETSTKEEDYEKGYIRA